jgi:hypothetical protein
MQEPQSMQVPSSQTALSSCIDKEPVGQTSMQAAQPMQISLSIFTAISNSYIFLFIILRIVSSSRKIYFLAFP